MEELSNEEDKYLTRVLYNNLGNTYLSDGDFYNAEKYYKKSLEKDNNYIYAILGLANIDIYNYQYSKNNNYYGNIELIKEDKSINNTYFCYFIFFYK